MNVVYSTVTKKLIRFLWECRARTGESGVGQPLSHPMIDWVDHAFCALRCLSVEVEGKRYTGEILTVPYCRTLNAQAYL